MRIVVGLKSGFVRHDSYATNRLRFIDERVNLPQSEHMATMPTRRSGSINRAPLALHPDMYTALYLIVLACGQLSAAWKSQ